MKNVLKLVLPLAFAAVLGGATGYVVVDEFVMQRPRQASKARTGTATGSSATANVGHGMDVAKFIYQLSATHGGN